MSSVSERASELASGTLLTSRFKKILNHCAKHTLLKDVKKKIDLFQVEFVAFNTIMREKEIHEEIVCPRYYTVFQILRNGDLCYMLYVTCFFYKKNYNRHNGVI